MYSKLEIINEMIVATGARPLVAAQTSHPLYTKADALLERVKASVQSFGLYFNTECREIEPDGNNNITVPTDCIKADPADRHKDLTLRNGKMYDLTTGALYEGDTAVRLKMIFDIAIEDMPLSAQEYIRAKAVYEFYLNEDGSDPKLSSYRNERDRGWQTLYREHIRSRQANIYDNSSNAITALRRGVGYGRYNPYDYVRQ